MSQVRIVIFVELTEPDFGKPVILGVVGNAAITVKCDRLVHDVTVDVQL